jgi:tellurite resistance protein TehA-like permease
MVNKESLSSILTRILCSFILLLFGFYYFDPFNFLESELDTLNFIVFGLHTPLLLTVLTIALSSILAVPFWFSLKLKTWWNSRPLIQLLILVLGISLLFLSGARFMMKYEVMHGDIAPKMFNNEIISIPGWFLVSVSLLIIDVTGIVDKLLKAFMRESDWTQRPNR